MEETTRINDVMKHKRWQELSEALAALRTAEKSDVTLICADKEFFGHKSVLEASSPYFVAMFHCGLEEAKSGKVFFQDTDPESLELILDYLYLGTVDKIKTIDQLKKVLESSHLLQLEQLVDFCYDGLTEQLSFENFVDIWNIADTFGNKVMVTKVFNYLMVAVNEVLYSPLFTCLSFEQLKAFLSFTSEVENFCDEFLIAIIAWLRKDLQERAVYAKELFEYADAKLLSITTLKMLLDDEELMNSCDEIRNGLKDIGFAVAYSNDSIATQFESLISTKLGNARIVFHSEYQLYCSFESYYESTVVELVNNVQEFDLRTMSWLPATTLPSSTTPVTTIISAQHYITLQDDILCTLTPSYTFNSLILSNLTYLKYLNRKHNTWEAIREPHCVINPRVVVTSSKYMYVSSTSKKCGAPVIEFNVLQCFRKLDWIGLPRPQIPDETKTHFFVYKDKLCVFYYTKGELVRLMFDHEEGKWLTKVLPIGPPGITDISCIYRGSPDQCIVFVSTIDAGRKTPNFIWDPESGKWSRLPLPKGKCELEDTDQLSKLYRVCEKKQ